MQGNTSEEVDGSMSSGDNLEETKISFDAVSSTESEISKHADALNDLDYFTPKGEVSENTVSASQNDNSEISSGAFVSQDNNESANVINRQPSLEEELLMEEELLKGEDDDGDINLNSDDLILDEESVMASELSQALNSVAGSQTSKPTQQKYEEISSRIDLEINIDSLLGSTSGIPDNNVDNIELNEAELLNEDMVNEMTNFVNKPEINVVSNTIMYDEDSLLRELEGNANNESEDIVLDENIDSLLVSGDTETVASERVDDQEENLLNNDSSMPLERDLDSQMDENALLADSEDFRAVLVGNKSVPMESNDTGQNENVKGVPMDENSVSINNENVVMEENSFIIDSQMIEESKTAAMDTGQIVDASMEENSMLMNEDDTEERDDILEAGRQIVDATMEENILLNVEDENMEDRPTIENSEITIDENNLLDEDTRDDLVATDDITINENILLADSESTNYAVESNVVEDGPRLVNENADKIVEHIDLNEDDSTNLSGISAESERTVNELEPIQNLNDIDEGLASDELEATTNDEGEPDAAMGFNIKINSVLSGDSISEIASASSDVIRTAYGEKLEDDYAVDENVEPNVENTETVLNDDDQVAIEECDQLTQGDQIVEDNLDSQAYSIVEPSDFVENADECSQPLIEHEEISLSNDFSTNETEFNQVDTENFDESIIKEEVLENEYEEDFLAKNDEEYQNTNEENREQYDDNADYDVNNTVVKEEMADIETLVDVKQEVLEESDHLAIDHSIKQEYMDSDAIKEEYSGDDMGNHYFNDDKALDGKLDNFNADVVPVALNRSDEFLKPVESEEMIVPASMIISVADIKNMQGNNMNSKGSEEIIISDKCVDISNLNDVEMDVENEGDSLLAPCSFACSVCHREYQTIPALQRHEKIHETDAISDILKEDINVRSEIISTLTAVEGMYKCTCGKSFKRRSSVVACMKTHRVRGIWCEHCCISFRRQRELRSHIIREHTKSSKNKKPKCTICNKDFAHQKSLVRHSKLHLKDIDLTDDVSTNEASDLDLDNVQNFNCELCNLGFTSESELLDHKSIAHPLALTEDSSAQTRSKDTQQPSLKLKFNCKTCKKVFLTLGALANHKVIHSKKANKMKFRCERCQESFQTRSELSSHRRLHCRGVLHHYSALQYIADRESLRTSKQVKCEVCAQTYANKEDMETHRDATHPFVTFSKEDATETRIFFK